MTGKPGRSGRKHQPGSPGSVTAPTGRPRRPPWLGKYAQRVWDQTCEDLMLMSPSPLSEVDGRFLSLYCEAWQTYFEARKIVNTKGADVETDYGFKPHSAVKRMNDAMNQINVFGSKFGLSPADRAAMKITGTGVAPERKNLSGMLAARADEERADEARRKGLGVVS